MKMSDYVRQHPMLIAIEATRSLPSYLGIALVASITQGGSSLGQMGFVFLAAFSALLLFNMFFSTLGWLYFYYRYDNGHIHIRRGIVFKSERSIKRERVQSINVYTNILQRAVGLATMQIKTAGTEETEVNLRALSLAEVESIRIHLKGGAERWEEGEEEESPLASEKLEGRDLWLAGATSGRFLILFSLIAFLASQLFAYMPDTFFDLIFTEIVDIPLEFLALALATLLILSYALSVVLFVIQYARFRIDRYQDRLEIRWGILKQNHVSIGLHRIQALTVQEGLIRQPLGLTTLYLEVAGGGSEGQEQISMLHPLLRFKDLGRFLSLILPEYEMPQGLNYLPERAKVRYIIRALIPTLIVAAVIWHTANNIGLGYGWLSLMLTIPAVVLALSRHANGATSLDDRQLTLRFRDVNRYHVLIKRTHLQSFTLDADPIQRYKSLRTVNAPVLSSPAAKNFRLKDIDSAEAERIWRWYSKSL